MKLQIRPTCRSYLVLIIATLTTLSTPSRLHPLIPGCLSPQTPNYELHILLHYKREQTQPDRTNDLCITGNIRDDQFSDSVWISVDGENQWFGLFWLVLLSAHTHRRVLPHTQLVYKPCHAYNISCQEELVQQSNITTSPPSFEIVSVCQLFYQSRWLKRFSVTNLQTGDTQ